MGLTERGDTPANDVDHGAHDHGERERGDDRKDPERTCRAPSDVQQADRNGNTERAEMTRIVDRRSTLTQEQTWHSQHQFGGRNDRERDPHPLPSPSAGRMNTRQHRRGDVRHRFRNTHAQHAVDLADVRPPITTGLAASEMGVGSGRFGGRALLVELGRQHQACPIAVHEPTGDVSDAQSSRISRQNVGVLDLDRLATAAQTGDREALDTFVRAIQGDVWRFCAHLTRPGEADDLAQESLLRVVAHLDRWQRGPVITWVLGVTRNVCFEHIRKRTRRRTDPAAEPSQPPTPDQFGVVEIRRLLEGVPYDQREALVLTQILGLPYADAADVAGCPIGTIRSRVARGREAMAVALRAGRNVADG